MISSTAVPGRALRTRRSHALLGLVAAGLLLPLARCATDSAVGHPIGAEIVDSRETQIWRGDHQYLLTVGYRDAQERPARRRCTSIRSPGCA